MHIYACTCITSGQIRGKIGIRRENRQNSSLLACKLKSQVSQSTNADDSHLSSWGNAAAQEGSEDRGPGAHQGSRVSERDGRRKRDGVVVIDANSGPEGSVKPIPENVHSFRTTIIPSLQT